MQRTRWAWRYTAPAQLRLNYSTFTVTYDAREINAKSARAMLRELYRMPVLEPERFQALQLGVARAAKHMYYSMTDCGARNCDAFETFKAVVTARGFELGEGNGETENEKLR